MTALGAGGRSVLLIKIHALYQDSLRDNKSTCHSLQNQMKLLFAHMEKTRAQDTIFQSPCECVVTWKIFQRK